MKNKRDATKSPDFLGYQRAGEVHHQKEEIQRLEQANLLISVVLGELHNIQELMGLSAIAEVEELEEKIKKGYEKIQEYLSRYEQGETLEQGQQQQAKASVPIEQHPFLEDMGGMPLEIDNIDREFLKELGISETADKAEMQNQIKNKLQNRLKQALKFAAKLQNELKAQPAYKPALKQANELVVKYRMKLEELKNKPILKPEAPEYVPRHTPPTPTPPRPF